MHPSPRRVAAYTNTFVRWSMARPGEGCLQAVIKGVAIMANRAQGVPTFAAPSFLPIAPKALQQVQLNTRQWFFRLVNQEERHGLLELVWLRLQQRFQAPYDAGPAQTLSAVLQGRDPASQSLHGQVRELMPLLVAQPERLRHFYFQHAPLFKVMGGWLDGVTSIAHAWRPDAGLLLQIHMRMVGDGFPERSQSRAFEQAALRAGVALGEVFSQRFSDAPEIAEAAFELPVFLLSLACFPQAFQARTLGVNLALCDYLDHLNLLRDGDTPLFGLAAPSLYRPLACAALEAYLREAPEGAQDEVLQGHACALALLAAEQRRLATELGDAQRFDEHAAMLTLIERLGHHGCGYHRRGQLGGEPIDHWLSPERFCPHATLAALADSRYVRPGEPARSALLNLIGKPEGRMFGVFSAQDIRVVERWIATLDPARSQVVQPEPRPLPSGGERDLCQAALAQARQQALDKYAGWPLQALYPLFLQIDQAPDALPAARAYVEDWLAQHRARLQRDGLPFERYSHAALGQWLEAQHARQVSSYQPLRGEPEETREEIIADALALAPLTLIDGAWLRQVVAPASVTSPIGALLYRTLVDELGQGDCDLHHGNIYRQLLASMQVEPCSFVEPHFAGLDCFDEDDLRVPVFWLAISLFPQSFQPETLGLNLAMELSGVGGEYRRSADILRHYGFSALFTDLHNTIDNVVSGHTAWAIEAIRLHLDDALQRGGVQEQARHWQRIWLGYRALSPPPRSPWQQAKRHLRQLRDTFTHPRGSS